MLVAFLPAHSGRALCPLEDPLRNISRFARGAALATGLALVLVGCGQAPEAPNESAAPSADAPEGFATCIVSDDGGFSDRSFNQSSAEGIRAASEALASKP